jgi:hypothetical protein
MSTKKELEDKKDYARLLYMQGEQQKTIAEKAGVSPQTVTKWVNTGNWSEQRAAQNITRPELVNKLLRTVDKMIEAVNTSEDPDAANGLGDKLAKFAATIEKLDKHTSIVDVIEVFMAFGKWLQYQAHYDEDITPELLKTINKYHNQYINHLMQNKLIK